MTNQEKGKTIIPRVNQVTRRLIVNENRPRVIS